MSVNVVCNVTQPVLGTNDSKTAGGMTVSECIPNTPEDMLKVAYQIGRYIQSLVTSKAETEDSDKPYNLFEGFFLGGPNPYHDQTRSGLMLEAYYGMPSRIHTPCGGWKVLGSGCGSYNKV